MVKKLKELLEERHRSESKFWNKAETSNYNFLAWERERERERGERREEREVW